MLLGMRQQGELGSPARTTVLAATILLLAAATFANETIATATYYTRYAAAAALIWLTVHQGRGTRRRFTDLLGAAKTLLVGSWGLVALSILSAAWSIDPRETLLQGATFGLLVVAAHVHITHRWHHPGTVEADFRTIFALLGVTVAASLALGTLVGTRLGGLYANPNTLGILAAFTVMLGIGLREVHPTPLPLLVAVIAFVTLVESENRSGLVGCAAAAVWLVGRRVGRPNPAAVVILCWSAAATLAVYLVAGDRIPLPAVGQRFNSTDFLTGRGAGWELAVRLWEQRPVQGYGFRVGEVIFARMQNPSSFQQLDAHSSYLQTLLELGWLGVVPFGLMLLGAVVGVHTTHDVGARDGIAGLVIVGLVSAIAESTLLGVGQAICWVFWVSAAALVSGSSHRVHEGGQKASVLGSRA